VQTEVLNVPVTHSSARFSMRFALARPYRSERRRFDQALAASHQPKCQDFFARLRETRGGSSGCFG
jgi:hypothetical protein